MISRIKYIFKRLIRFLLKLWYGRFCRIKKRIFFTSFMFSRYACNPRAICEKMHQLYPTFELVWLFNKNFSNKYDIIPNYIKKVQYTDKNFYKYSLTSFCIINNFEYDNRFKKRKGQFYIQTYHGDRGFKKILRMYKPDLVVRDQYLTDLCLVGSKFAMKNLELAMNYHGKFLTSGTPRNDSLVLKNKNRDEILKILNLDSKKKYLLYAPTFRNKNFENENGIESMKKVLDLLGLNWICLIRLHSNSNYCLPSFDDDRFIDISDYPDTADILYICDFLISDYSSIPYDYALTGNPIILRIYDYNDYIKNSRELSSNIFNVGLKIAKNDNELLEIIKNTTKEEYTKDCKKALKYFDTSESGHSSDDVCEIINNRYLYFKKHHS